MQFTKVALLVALVGCNSGSKNSGKAEEVAQKHTPSVLVLCQKEVDEVCACTDLRCVETALGISDKAAWEKLANEDPAKEAFFLETLRKCVEQIVGSLPRNREAGMYLKLISNSARTHYFTTGDSENFPKSSEITPPLGTCCNESGACAPSSGNWQVPSWTELGFEMTDPHYYSYEFKSNNNGGKKSYTASAYGDLDCDGVYSTYSISGEVIDGNVEPSDEILEVNPLE